MHHRTRIATFTLLLVAMGGIAHAVSVVLPSQPGSPLNRLAFMTGCWRGQFGGGAASPGTIEEYYSTPTSNMIIGVTRFVRGGRTVDFEFTRITAGDSGVTLMPQPRGRPPTPFRMTANDSTSAVWENPQHDFPQKISYRRIAGDSIIAAIEGPGQNGTQRMEWRMGKVRCGER
jgi:hypothetical protein